MDIKIGTSMLKSNQKSKIEPTTVLMEFFLTSDNILCGLINSDVYRCRGYMHPGGVNENMNKLFCAAKLNLHARFVNLPASILILRLLEPQEITIK